MIDPLPLLKIAPIFAVALMSPGPDFMMVSATALARGRMAGLAAACGIACGAAVYAGLSVLGLGVMFAALPWLAAMVRVGGGLYLVYLAVQLWRGSFRASGLADKTVASRRNPFFTGLLTNLTNPKALAFFTSIFAVALPTGVNGATQAALVGTVFAMAVGWFALVTLLLSHAASRKVYVRVSRWIDRAAGACLGFFGVRLIVSAQD